MTYSKPIQDRAKKTTELFLQALAQQLLLKGYAKTTLDDVVSQCGFTRAAFIKRFGSKEAAVLVLFEAYCDEAHERMTKIQASLGTEPSLHNVLYTVSSTFEDLLTKHLAVNRAMHEHFLQNLEVHNLTKRIFIQCVAMMEQIQSEYLKGVTCSSQGAWAAAQLLVTTDYNYALKAMPGLPADKKQRHELIADVIEVALKR